MLLGDGDGEREELMTYAHDRRVLQKKAKHRRYRNCPAGCGKRARASLWVRSLREFRPEGMDLDRGMLVLICQSCGSSKVLAMTCKVP